MRQGSGLRSWICWQRRAAACRRGCPLRIISKASTSGRLPAVIFLHATGDHTDGPLCDLTTLLSRHSYTGCVFSIESSSMPAGGTRAGANLQMMKGRMEAAAERGYLTAAIDCR